jgi:hypothetical protein
MVQLGLLPLSLRQNQNGSDEAAAVIFETKILCFCRLLPLSSRYQRAAATNFETIANNFETNSPFGASCCHYL